MEPKKFLFVTLDALITDVAWQVAKEGHEVKFYTEEKKEKDVGDGFVEKTDDWKKDVDWADVIVFDDVLGQGKKAQELREQGKFVIGGTPYTDKLEDDRSFGQEELKNAGVPIIPQTNFTSFDEAIEFVQKNPDRYVVKPSGEAQNVKQLLYVGEDENGKDVIQVLDHYKKIWSNRVKEFQLQKRINGVEVAVGAFFNGKEFIYPINVNFEHKKLFPGNIGPSTGEMGCYDEATEVLTDNGWKFFNELSHEDALCTLNPENDNIEFHKPSLLVTFSHHNKLLSVENQTLDMMVTLDHNMYVCSQADARKGRNNFRFVKAKNLECQSVAKRTGNWTGVEQQYFVLPSIPIGHYSGKQVVYQASPEVEISMDNWVAFMGIWLADGWVSDNKVCISQKQGEKSEAISYLLDSLPFDFKQRGDEFYLYNKQLAEYLRQFGKADDKHVPKFIKELSKRQIELFLKWYCLGDGTIMKNDFRIFYTVSSRLADDVQELLLKIGRVGIVKKRTRIGFGDDHYANSGSCYEIIERVKKTNSWIDKRDMKVVDYDGKVYCATVKNHVMYVRRSGKPYWCGNTSMFWSSPNKIFNSTLKKMEPKLKEEGYIGYIDINCIVNNNGIYPLEFTARFGYPTISIQQEGMLIPIGEFLYELSRGNGKNLKTKSGFQVGVRVVVPPFPFNDNKAFETNSKDAVIIFKKNGGYNGIHIEDVKLSDGEWIIAGNTGVVLIVVGSGQTMKQAQKQAYNRISNIMIPNMFYRKDIGDRWFEDSDKLHNWGYLRES